MRLYKYMSEKSALRFARSGLLRFSPPLSFNDPFEMRPAFTAAEFDELSKNTSVTKSTARQNLFGDNLFHTVAGAISSKIGMICLTETPTDILMWAHYAENHRGIVVEFDASHRFFGASSYRNKPQFLMKVMYSDDRVSLGWDYMRKFPDRDYDGRGYRHLFDERHPIFFTKSTHWSYEREWRLVRQNLPPSEGAGYAWRETRASGRHYDFPDRNQLVKIPPRAVTAFIIGASCRRPSTYGELNGLEEDLSAIVRDKASLAHVRFYKAALDDEHYSMRLYDLDSSSAIEENVPLEFSARVCGFMGRVPTRP